MMLRRSIRRVKETINQQQTDFSNCVRSGGPNQQNQLTVNGNDQQHAPGHHHHHHHGSFSLSPKVQHRKQKKSETSKKDQPLKPQEQPKKKFDYIVHSEK
jgi:hypothetical protein